MGIGREPRIRRLYEGFGEHGLAWVVKRLNAERQEEGCCPKWEAEAIHSVLGQLGLFGRQGPPIGADRDEVEESYWMKGGDGRKVARERIMEVGNGERE